MLNLIARFFIPSWNFFDKAGPFYRLEGPKKESEDPARTIFFANPPNSHLFSKIFFNPEGNLQLFLQSLIDQAAIEFENKELSDKELAQKINQIIYFYQSYLKSEKNIPQTDRNLSKEWTLIKIFNSKAEVIHRVRL